MAEASVVSTGYLYVPHLPLAVALRARPELEEGRQVIVGGSLAGGGTVVDASEECLAAGVRVRRPLREALEYCPGAKLVQADPDAERNLYRALLDLIATVAPQVEDDGTGRMYFAPDRRVDREDGRWLLAMLRSLVRERLGLRPCLALGPGRFIARIAAELDPEAATGAPIVLPCDAAEYLAPLPLSILPLPPRALERLQLLGVATVGQFARLPRNGLARRFGREAVEAHRLAGGYDDRPVVPRELPDVRAARQLFEPPVESLAPLLAAAERLMERLCGELRAEGRAFRRLTVGIEGESGGRIERTAELRAPATAPEDCRATLRSLIWAAGICEPVAAVTVAPAAIAAVEGSQPRLFEDGPGRSERDRRIEAATREIGRRYPARLQRVVPNEFPTLLDEHRFALLPYEPDGVRQPALPDVPPAALRRIGVERRGGRPYVIEAGRRDELVAVCACWRAEEWWPARIERVYWRIRTRSRRILTLSRDDLGWRLVEVLD